MATRTKDPLANLRAMVCRAVVRSLSSTERSREEQLALLIAEQAADMQGSRVAADGSCTRNLPGTEGRNWRNYADYR